jgi:hypothetical protein
MQETNMLSSLFRLFLRAAWAPIAVLILHRAIAGTSLRDPLDFTVHFLGGAAIAFFLFHAIECFPTFIGRITAPSHYLFSFTSACTVGLFWEFGELLSDVFLHTHIQHDLHETLSDLIADASGTTSSLVLLFLIRSWSRRRARPGH